MAFITESLLIDLLIGLLTFLVVVYLYFASAYNYWKHRGVRYVEPNLLFGNLKDCFLGRRSLFDIYKEIYQKLDGERFGGYYEITTPTIMIRDLELIERILIKDFNYFVDRGFGSSDPKNEPLTTALSTLQGNQWRTMRHKLIPTFSSGKLKGMFEQIYNSGECVLEELRKCSESGEPVEARTVLTMFTTDVIASCAFGLQFKHDSDNSKQFRKMADKITNPATIQKVKFLVALFSQTFAKAVGIKRIPSDVSDYFLNTSKATVEFREKNNIKRNDFLQLLMTVKEESRNKKVTDINNELKDEDNHLKPDNVKPTNDEDVLEFTDSVLAAQSFQFLIAGSETTSGTMSFVLYFIAANPVVQRRLQDEVDQQTAEEGFSYEAVQRLTYLDQVIQEGLRIRPFVSFLSRICTVPYKVPGTDLTLEKGVRVNIPVYPIHMDPRFYSEPETFNPERFKDHNHRPSSTYMPFGDGPRMCIAMRFAVLEMKVCLSRILSQFSVSVSDKMVQPLRYDPSSFIPRALGGVWLHFHQRRAQ